MAIRACQGLRLRTVVLADKLRLFMPDCYARFPIEWDGHLYEISVVYRGPDMKGSDQ